MKSKDNFSTFVIFVFSSGLGTGMVAGVAPSVSQLWARSINNRF